MQHEEEFRQDRGENERKARDLRRQKAIFLRFIAANLRTCIHNWGMLDGRVFFSSDKEISLAILTDCKGNRRSMAGKRLARQRATVVNTGSKPHPRRDSGQATEVRAAHTMFFLRVCKDPFHGLFA